MGVDLVFTGGVLLTQDPARPRAEALAVAGGRVAAVGSSREIAALAGPDPRRIDLAGRTLIPGFHDAHAHLWKIGHLLTTMLDLRRVASLLEMQALLREAAARLPEGAWLLGRGYNEVRMKEGRQPDRRDLDAAVPDRPVFLIRTCAHMAAANTAAMRAAGIDAATPAPAGGFLERDTAGEPTGRFRETGLGLVQRAIPPPTAAEYAAMIEAASRHQLALGITSTTDAGVPPGLLAAYRDLDREGRLLQRVNVMAARLGDADAVHPLPERHVSERLRVDTVKLWADGGLSGATAALRLPYRHQESHGILRLDAEALAGHVRAIHEAGLRAAVHAIGDAALDATLAALEAAGPRRGHPDRIEHFGLPDTGHLERAARLGVAVVPQTIFLLELGANFRRYLPDSLHPRVYPLRAMLEAGLPMALSSDAPVVESDDPLQGIACAVLRRDREGGTLAPEQALTVAEALRAYTVGGAVACGDSERGALKPGQRADLAVLSQNPLDLHPEALHEVRVLETWRDGERVFEA